MERFLLGLGLHEKLYGESERALKAAMFNGTLFEVEEAKYSE